MSVHIKMTVCRTSAAVAQKPRHGLRMDGWRDREGCVEYHIAALRRSDWYEVRCLDLERKDQWINVTSGEWVAEWRVSYRVYSGDGYREIQSSQWWLIDATKLSHSDRVKYHLPVVPKRS